MLLLPSEIYAAIIDQLEEADVQSTLLSLTRAIPYSPVPQHRLFQRIIITKRDQLGPLYARIRPHKDDTEQPYKWIQVFSLETWTADAEMVLDVLALLPNLHTLTIWVGPKNFAPEHLEELFCINQTNRCLKCVDNLRYLSLRFRPYVQKATYQQFLSGSYFDSTLDALSRWPTGHLPSLTIVQDPLTYASGTSEGSEVSPPPTFSLGLPQRTLAAGFAQPIVFFQLEATLPSLLRAPYLRYSLKHVRLRFPSRNLTRSLTQAPEPHPPSYGASVPAGSEPSRRYTHSVLNAHLSPGPHLSFLDLSTCSILESSLPQIISHYPSLTHLIVDDSDILRNGDIAVRDNSREWGVLSMSCAIAGIRMAREKEKKFEGSKRGQGLHSKIKDPKHTKGRKGLATATLSLRKEDPLPTPVPYRLGSRPTSDKPDPERIRVLPPLPTLRFLSTTLYIPHSLIPVLPDIDTPNLPQVTHSPLLKNINNEWERGWAEGVVQLVKVRERLRTSWRNKLVRVMRFATPDELVNASLQRHTHSGTGGESTTTSRLHSRDSDSESNSSSSFSEANHLEDKPAIRGPLAGLIEVIDESEFDVDVKEAGSGLGKAPVLCLAGTSAPSPTNSINGAELPPTADRSNTGTVAISGLLHALGCAHEAGNRIWIN